jgi:cellulose biosynthesis protein BcsQ
VWRACDRAYLITLPYDAYAKFVPTLILADPTTTSVRRRRISASGLLEPLRVAIAHNKGGVSKTTSTFVLGRHLSRNFRVELVDLDRTRYLTEVVMQLSPRGDTRLSPRLWLRHERPKAADVVLIDSEPAREQHARQALLEAEYVLIPVPPEPMCLKGLVLMLDVIDYVRTDREGGNPFLQVLGVLPTLYDQRWPNHRAWLQEMTEECRGRGLRVFPPIPRRQSYTTLSMSGHDYVPVAAAITDLVEKRRADEQHG